MSVSESLGYKVPDKHMHGLNQLVPKCFLDDELQGSMNGDYDNKPIERLNRVLSRICTEETLNVVPIIESSALNIDKKNIVGKGGKAYVWSGKMKSVKSILDVAVKATKNEDTKTTLRHVEQQMLKLNQENFVDYYGIYHDVLSHDTYIVMELLRGESLAHHLKNSFKKMTFKIKIDILHQSAVAIAYAHSKDILVTDFKPDNIVFEKMPDFEHNSNLHIKLIDVTKNDFTIAYSSRYALEGKFSKETDIYTFGVVVWQLFTTGQRPYSNCPNALSLALEIGNGRQLEIPSDIHVGIKDLILACWTSPCEITMENIVNILSEMQIHADAMEYVASPIPFDLF